MGFGELSARVGMNGPNVCNSRWDWVSFMLEQEGLVKNSI